MAKTGDIFHVFKVPNSKSKRIKKNSKPVIVPRIEPDNESTFSSVLETEQERKKELNRKFSQTFRNNQHARLHGLQQEYKKIRKELQSVRAINKQLVKRNRWLRSKIRLPDGTPLISLSDKQIQHGIEEDFLSQERYIKQKEFCSDNFLVTSRH